MPPGIFVLSFSFFLLWISWNAFCCAIKTLYRWLKFALWRKADFAENHLILISLVVEGRHELWGWVSIFFYLEENFICKEFPEGHWRKVHLPSQVFYFLIFNFFFFYKTKHKNSKDTKKVFYTPSFCSVLFLPNKTHRSTNLIFSCLYFGLKL